MHGEIIGNAEEIWRELLDSTLWDDNDESDNPEFWEEMKELKEVFEKKD